MLLGTEGQVGGSLDFVPSHESFLKGLQHQITRTWPSLYLHEWVWGWAEAKGGGVAFEQQRVVAPQMPAHIAVCAMRKHNKVKSIYSVFWLFGSR